MIFVDGVDAEFEFVFEFVDVDDDILLMMMAEIFDDEYDDEKTPVVDLNLVDDLVV